MSTPIFFAEDVTRVLTSGCQMPGCTHEAHMPEHEIFLHPRCHADAGTWAMIEAGQPGIVTLICKACRAPVVALALARKAGSRHA